VNSSSGTMKGGESGMFDGERGRSTAVFVLGAMIALGVFLVFAQYVMHWH